MTDSALVRLARSVAVAALLALLAVPAAGAGVWHVSGLGAPGGVVLKGRHADRSLAYTLPAGAAQGKPLWYLLHIRARVVFRPGPGEYVLSADSNGLTAVQIIFKVAARSITTDTLGLVDGHRVVTTQGRTAVVDFSNYEQFAAVRPGANTLHFQLETLAGAGVRSLHISPASGLETTRILPDELRLQVPQAPLVVAGGETVRVRYRLVRRGGRADGPVRIWVAFDGAGLTRSGAIERAYTGLGNGRSGAFVLRAKTNVTGTYLVHLSVPQRYNQPSAAVSVTIVRPGGPRVKLGLVGGIGGALLLTSALTLAAVRRMRRG